ncbi:hypothetical protein [Nocardia araoensis]|uniref:hypothetical protein n=1 Tax=Nocardia araoensis TaxID=228600 RepID=UPI00030C506B|nr:hypothetical protein [Nocardia araoensis]
MLHLVYRFAPTPKARADLAAFWRWIADRQLWFYDGLDMVLDTTWHTVTIGEHVHCLEHKVTFADEAAWGRYRQEVHRRSTDPECPTPSSLVRRSSWRKQCVRFTGARSIRAAGWLFQPSRH